VRAAGPSIDARVRIGPAERLILIGFAALLVVVVLSLAGVLVYPFVDPNDPAGRWLAVGVLVLVALWAVAGSRNGSELGGRLFQGIVLFSLYTPVAIRTFRIANGALDHAPGQAVPFTVSGHVRYRGGGVGLELDPSGDSQSSFVLGVQHADGATPVGTTLYLQVRPGRFGHPWFSTYRVGDGKWTRPTWQ
jgi:hypothetical protein